MRRTRHPSEALTLRIPYWLYDAGCFKGRRMGSVLQVFLCLVRYMDWHSGNGCLGRAKIAAVTGIKDRDTLARALTTLQQWGVVKVWWRRTDRGDIRYYNVATSQDSMRANAITHLQHMLKRAPRGYVSGNCRGRGAGISRSQCSTILFPKKATAVSCHSPSQPPSFKTAILACVERSVQRARSQGEKSHVHGSVA